MEKGIHPKQRYLFPGDSSYPLSPINDDAEEISDNDQLQVVLKCIGRQDHQDLSFITEDSATTYVGVSQVDLKKIKFEQEYPYTSKETTSILYSMLEFNPYFRKPASQLLKEGAFESHLQTNPKLGNEAPEKIILDFDKKGSYDYDELKLKNYTIDDFKAILLREIGIIKSQDYQ